MLTAARNELLTRVGPGTPMGDLLRRYWQPIAGASELAKNPLKPIRLLGEDLVLYKDLGGTTGWSTGTARTGAPTCPTAGSRSAASAAATTAGASTRAGRASSSLTRTPPVRSRRRPAAASRPIRCASSPGCCGPIWDRSRRPSCRCGSRSPGPTASARSCSPTCRATGSSARRTRSTRCISNGCTTTGRTACAAATPMRRSTSS